MKCTACGATLGLFKKPITLADGAICRKCFERLGFNSDDASKYSNAKCSEIMSGYGHYTKMHNKKHNDELIDVLDKHELPVFSFAHYGEERAVDATDEEAQVFAVLCDMFGSHGYDSSQLRLVRKSSNYVAASIGDFDLARFKYTEKAKWIIFPYAETKAVKHYISVPGEIMDMDDLFSLQVEALGKHIELKNA